MRTWNTFDGDDGTAEMRGQDSHRLSNSKTNLGTKLGELDQFDVKIEQNFVSALRLCICTHIGSNTRVETPVWMRTQFGMRHRTKKRVT
jgi:hypothetical protein